MVHQRCPRNATHLDEDVPGLVLGKRQLKLLNDVEVARLVDTDGLNLARERHLGVGGGSAAEASRVR